MSNMVIRKLLALMVLRGVLYLYWTLKVTVFYGGGRLRGVEDDKGVCARF